MLNCWIIFASFLIIEANTRKKNVKYMCLHTKIIVIDLVIIYICHFIL